MVQARWPAQRGAGYRGNDYLFLVVIMMPEARG